MKTTKLLSIALSSLFFIFFLSCSNNDGITAPDEYSSNQVSLLKVSTDGVSTFEINNVCPVFGVTAPLTADEIEFLYAVREDEKVSRDLNLAFATLYPLSRQFANIGAAEATHIAVIETLLSYYEIEYPSLGQAGIFEDASRQTRYNELFAKGTTLAGAYNAIALLEEENIVAYNAVLANITNTNIQLIISNMMRSSSNHLKATVRQLSNLGETYTPALLEIAVYNDIINSAFNQGNRYGQQGRNGQNTNSAKGDGNKGNKGSVNASGTCTGTGNGTAPGSGGSKGQTGKGYRGGRQ